jgi:hypothetical protein
VRVALLRRHGTAGSALGTHRLDVVHRVALAPIVCTEILVVAVVVLRRRHLLQDNLLALAGLLLAQLAHTLGRLVIWQP